MINLLFVSVGRETKLFVVGVVVSLVAGTHAAEGQVEWWLNIGVESSRVASGGAAAGGSTVGLVDLGVSGSFGNSPSGRRPNRYEVSGLASWNGGVVPSERLGDIQGSSNIENVGTARLFSAWYERTWGLRRKSGLLIGLHDYNSEFNVLDSAQLFLNSSFGLSAELGQIPPSTFPETALGMRYRVEPIGKTYLLAAAYDGVPGSPEAPYGTNVRIGSDEGWFQCAEIGRRWAEDRGKLSLGYWNRTTDFVGADSLPYRRNSGAYLIAEFPLGEPAGRSIRGFIQAGTARRKRNDIDAYFGAGINLAERWGLAIGSAEFSDGRSAETAVEVTYVHRLNAWIDIQPDVQWIRHPGGGDALDDALQLGVTLWIRVPQASADSR